MPTRRRVKGEAKMIAEVVERVSGAERTKVRTSFLLTEEPYERFRENCEAQGLKPSRVIDEMIAAFNRNAPRRKPSR